MLQRSFFCLWLIAVMCSLAYSQARSVTNADLEKYKQSRLKAEQEYRENYARLGFPSPEELERRREQSLKETEALSAKLRAERLEREKLELQQWESERLAASQSVTYSSNGQYFDPYFGTGYYGGGYYGGGYYGGNAYRGRRGGRGYYGGRSGYLGSGPIGYFAGGQFWGPPVGLIHATPPTRFVSPIRGGGGWGGGGGPRPTPHR
jgi:hypothetical protein